jgi:hypothetical protein
MPTPVVGVAANFDANSVTKYMKNGWMDAPTDPTMKAQWGAMTDQQRSQAFKFQYNPSTGKYVVIKK